MLSLPLTLFLFAWSSVVDAGAVHKNQPCNITNNRLQVGTYQFYTDCDSETFCNSSGLCDKRGCRRDDFPFGYSQDSKGIPPKCPKGQFCPDEEDACQPLLAVGSPCQLNRDGEYEKGVVPEVLMVGLDQCEPPSNFEELADTSNRGLNVNGSVCLNNVCTCVYLLASKPCGIVVTGNPGGRM
jgi:hypothetical protein